MLDQAIVDATALKEAAIKNAEQEILEKYSQDIKEAVNTLLEQDDLLGLEEPEEEEAVLDSIPLAAAGGEELCGCPEDDEVITVDLVNLMKQAGEEEPEVGELSDRDELAGEIDDEVELREEKTKDKDDDEEEDEDVDLDEGELKELAEELTFEYNALSSGYSSGIPGPNLEQEQLVQQVQRDIAEANKEKKNLKENLHKLNKQNQKFRKIILQLKDKLDEVSVSNARLLYTNRVLENPSLNERQKSKIVETISKAQTIEKAQMIYEALQSAVEGAISQREKPESLNEVVSKKSTMVFSGRREERQQSDHVLTRMQRLAGIKKS
jgi:DNA repair exonuclease SbcCD ATPase subunit